MRKFMTIFLFGVMVWARNFVLVLPEGSLSRFYNVSHHGKGPMNPMDEDDKLVKKSGIR